MVFCPYCDTHCVFAWLSVHCAAGHEGASAGPHHQRVFADEHDGPAGAAAVYVTGSNSCWSASFVIGVCFADGATKAFIDNFTKAMIPELLPTGVVMESHAPGNVHSVVNPSPINIDWSGPRPRSAFF